MSSRASGERWGTSGKRRGTSGKRRGTSGKRWGNVGETSGVRQRTSRGASFDIFARNRNYKDLIGFVKFCEDQLGFARIC